nr:glycosyltransferase [Oceanipulchritudo coccoides]
MTPEGSRSIDGRKVITYAGNMGEGQGLDRIIPDAAKALESHYVFHLYGDGGTRKRLTSRIEELNISNVVLHDPVKRDELLDVYRKSDFLFVHLNRLKAFEKALPSKFFEYGAIGLPIIAGVAGYAREFVRDNLPDAILFDPCDSPQLTEKLLNFRDSQIDRSEFIKKFKRTSIMSELADLYLKKTV